MSSLYPAIEAGDDFHLEKAPISEGKRDSQFVVHVPEPTRHTTVNVVEEEAFSPARSCCCATKICLSGWALTFLLLAVALTISGGMLTYGLGAAVYNFGESCECACTFVALMLMIPRAGREHDQCSGPVEKGDQH